MIPEHIENELFEGSYPFWLKSENESKSVVICLHGFGASPYEARPIADKIFEKDIDAVGLLLLGHGIKNKELAKKAMSKCKINTWVDPVREAIKKAREIYENVYIYGQSMGGAISLLIASEGLVDACAVTAPGIKLPTGVGVVKFFGLFNINVPHSEKANDFFNETYLFRNLKSVKTLLNIARKARKALDKITCPIFICHSHNDPVITPKIVDWIKENAKGEVKVKWFDTSKHTLPLDVDALEVANSIAKFFDSQK